MHDIIVREFEGQQLKQHRQTGHYDEKDFSVIMTSLFQKAELVVNAETFIPDGKQIYIIESFTEDKCKIGFSGNFDQRLNTLKRGAQGEGFGRTFTTELILNFRNVEKIIHEKLHNHRLGREWFNVSFNYAKEVVSSTKEIWEIDTPKLQAERRLTKKMKLSNFIGSTANTLLAKQPIGWIHFNVAKDIVREWSTALFLKITEWNTEIKQISKDVSHESLPEPQLKSQVSFETLPLKELESHVAIKELEVEKEKILFELRMRELEVKKQKIEIDKLSQERLTWLANMQNCINCNNITWKTATEIAANCNVIEKLIYEIASKNGYYEEDLDNDRFSYDPYYVNCVKTPQDDGRTMFKYIFSPKAEKAIKQEAMAFISKSLVED